MDGKCENVNSNETFFVFKPPCQGYFITPTIVTDISDESRCVKEEIFGPVVCLSKFKTQEVQKKYFREMLFEFTRKQLNGQTIPYMGYLVRILVLFYHGLILLATVWSSNSDELLNTANGLRVGTVWCNTWLVSIFIYKYLSISIA